MALHFYRGAEGRKRLQEEERQRQLRAASNVRRFWQERDTSCFVTVLDKLENIEWYYEHSLQLAGSRMPQQFICTKDEEDKNYIPCIPCEQGDYSVFTLFLTIISHRKWTDRNGKVHVNEKTLLPLKSKAQKNFLLVADRVGECQFVTFELFRTSDHNAPATGDTFMFKKRWTPVELRQKFFKPSMEEEARKAAGRDQVAQQAAVKKAVREFFSPYNYGEVLTRKTSNEMRELLGITAASIEPDEFDAEEELGAMEGVSEIDDPAFEQSISGGDETEDESVPFDEDADSSGDDAFAEEPEPEKAKKEKPKKEKAVKEKAKPKAKPKEDEPEDDAGDDFWQP